MSDERLFPCDYCGTEGRIYSDHANDPHPRDEGECPVCQGTGSVDAKTFVQSWEGDEDDPLYLKALAEDAWENDLQRLSERMDQLKRMREACDAPGGYSDEVPF